MHPQDITLAQQLVKSTKLLLEIAILLDISEHSNIYQLINDNKKLLNIAVS